MSETKRKQPEWNLPKTNGELNLQLFNSLTRNKQDFKTINFKKILWYNCGPTVYDSSHMGHARSYITFDIIRRVLRDYFHYDIFFVQNVTDIDDKIIRRARQNYLFENYFKNNLNEIKNGSKDLSIIKKDGNDAINLIKEKCQKEMDPDKKTMFEKMIDQASKSLNDLDDPEKILLEMKSIFSIWLDENHGQEVCDKEIFISLPRFYENEFNNDMRSLNILPPDCVTRVSEFVPEVIEYIQKIIDNGYAYVSNGSVYFDTEKFANSPQHFYAKLVPEAYGDCKALAEGEGDLLTSNSLDEKRNQNDFALWKCSKPGEPWWQSPWGNGRPGWHIECSVMASSIIGKQMDIHSGGVDLRFPHHDNEMAQSEAYFNTGLPWVNYFLHSGHLTISGCKMSKSLKNFITIKDALNKNTARQLRLAFLLHSWKDTLDYSENTMNDAIHFEKILNEFFLTVKDILRQNDRLNLEQRLVKWELEEQQLHSKFLEHQQRIDQALNDNIDTKKTLEEIRRLISLVNIYIQNKQNQSNPTLIFTIANYITKLLDIFGCITICSDEKKLIGFPLDQTNTTNGSVEDRESIVFPFIETIAKLRDEIRLIAKDLKQKQLFQLCDRIRDDILPELGVKMEDYETSNGQQQYRLKLMDPETLKKEMEAKKLAEDNKKMEEQRKKVEPKPDPIDPKKMFLQETDKYSKFDENGMPTHDNEGKELTKSALKKIIKRYQLQEKKFNDFLKSQSSSS